MYNTVHTAHTDSLFDEPIINKKMKVEVPPTAPKVEPQLKKVHQPLLPVTGNYQQQVITNNYKSTQFKITKQVSSPKQLCKFCKKQYIHT